MVCIVVSIVHGGFNKCLEECIAASRQNLHQSGSGRLPGWESQCAARTRASTTVKQAKIYASSSNDSIHSWEQGNRDRQTDKKGLEHSSLAVYDGCMIA